MRGVLFTIGLVTALTLTSPLHAEPISPEQIRVYLVKVEGIRTCPYRDGDNWSVGIGHALPPDQPRKLAYLNDEIYDFFDADLANALRICRKGVKRFDALPEDAQLVAIGLAWTVGSTSFMRFTDFRAQLSHRHFSRAATALQNSRWWSQVSRTRAQDAFDRLVGLD